MRRGICVVVSAATLAWNLAVSATESHPNFSGMWQLDKTHSVAPPQATSRVPVGQGDVTLVIDHQATTLKIERRVRIMTFERSLTSIYYTDGRESSNTNLLGHVILSKARWEGQSLVIESRGVVERNGQTQVMEGTDIYHLSEDQRVLFVDATRKKPGQDSPEVSHLIFTKR